MVYEIQCAWCGKHLGSKEAPANGMTASMIAMGLPIISHGICEDCKDKALEEYRNKGKGGNDV